MVEWFPSEGQELPLGSGEGLCDGKNNYPATVITIRIILKLL